MNECVLCGHQTREHGSDGCRGRCPRFGGCSCGWTVLEPLPVDAGAGEHRTRSDSWDRQAVASWDLALRSRDDLDRWYALMRSHRVARAAEIAHRRAAASLARSITTSTWPAIEPAPEAEPPDSVPEPDMGFAHRLELARIA